MASIDLARRQMMLEGETRLDAMLRLAEVTRVRINSIAGFDVLGVERAFGNGSGFYDLDRIKLLIDTTRTGWSGSDAQRFLNHEFGVQPELSGPGYLLCILTVGSIPEDVDHLVRGLHALTMQEPPHHEKFSGLTELAGRVAEQLPETVMSPREAFYASHLTIPFTQALGRIAGEIITPYPPGIPVMMPGERFNRDTIELLAAVKRSHCPISAVDASFETVRIIR